MPRIALLLLLASASLADDLHLPNGNAFAKDVMVVEEKDGKVYYLDKQLKRRSWDKSQIGRIARKRCDVHEFVEREEKAKSGDDFFRLAEWAKEKRFHKSVIASRYARAIEIDPEHEGANLVLGRVRYDDRWMEPAERDRLVREKEEAAKRAQGLVRFEDRWVTPEDKEKLDRGLRRHEGIWMTPDEIKEAQGFVKYEGKWVKKDELAALKLVGPAREDTGLGARLRVHQTERFIVMGDLTEAQLAILGKTMERLYVEWVRIFPDTEQMTDLFPGKYRMYAFRKNRPYQKLVRARFARQKKSEEWGAARVKLEQARMKVRLRETSFWDVSGEAMSAHVQMPDPFEGLKSHCVHFATNVIATRYASVRFPTWWMNEGLAYYFERKITGVIQTYTADVGGAGYARVAIDDTNKNPWLDATKWQQLVLQLLRGGRDPKLDVMKTKVLWGGKKRLTAQELAKGWTVVSYLIENDTPRFAKFFREAKEGSGSEVEREVAAMLRHYGSYTEVEKGWRAYAANGYKIVR